MDEFLRLRADEERGCGEVRNEKPSAQPAFAHSRRRECEREQDEEKGRGLSEERVERGGIADVRENEHEENSAENLSDR